MPKLKEREFYCVGQRKKCTAPADEIVVVQFKNGVYALEGYLPKYDAIAYKFIKDSKVNSMINKYGA